MAMLKRSWLPYLLIVLGFAVTLAALVWQLARDWPVIAAGGAWRMPKSLAGKSLIAQKSGAVALAEIESLHGKGFELTDGTVVHYGDATVWVAKAKDEAAAKSMVDTMTHRVAATRIADGRSPFTPTRTREFNGRTVWTLLGTGQLHFYWQSGDKVVWLAISPAQAERGLSELMPAIK